MFVHPSSSLAKLLIVVFVAFGYLAEPGLAQVSIQPAFVELDLTKGRPRGQFTVTNTTDKTQRFRIRSRYFEYSEGGSIEFPKPVGKQSLAERIRFNPTEFDMPAKSSRVVRFVILPRSNLDQGEYWAAMSLDNLSVRQQESDLGDGRSVSLAVQTSLLVPIFGHVGEVRYAGQIQELEFRGTPQGVAIGAFVRNNGTGRLLPRGTYELWDRDDKPVAKGKIGYGYVMAKARRHFHSIVAKDLPPGDYKVKLILETGRKDLTLEAEQVINWTPPPPPSLRRPEPPTPEPRDDAPAAQP